MKLSIVAQSVMTLLSMVGVAHAEVAVIVNPALTTAPTQSQVANIFLGKDKSLKGVDQDSWTPTKDKFYSAVTSKSESQLKSYWSGLVFTGKGQPLPHVADDAAVVAQVSAQPDAIGYVDKATVNDKVKVLFTLP
ncbi:phosphate ABC transporter substrate-binding protein [Pseudomonas gingeri]|uniref:Phosphate ABC transporter substrate-binding protein n=1 Tax=Pseudomonas gingeri TaxID=117681 RepID=A0A7Y7YH87_9PSED|nr:phosphate ABC transporter substrate-binding protein [Pseudomonas gingeri]NVZ99183.1 phosphate ABC transporter substrate-binding protein [Pseudomonas gingeri]NWA13228.1 phosphate ABC transporter substrate-binding protein [Pseudomonas gingeri]NWA55489.1 phosphate ABC transporter substrate-binding protein [Pseudomonas gingeri]NWA95657.1 phosphate ABC transporter substrate-binding protein [Pseudomonas gingeri]NWB00744.1 phosphate ABC transporter substrate-binding protein [Pseudomonas gingeri]